MGVLIFLIFADLWGVAFFIGRCVPDETRAWLGRDSNAQGCAGAAKGRTPESGPPHPPTLAALKVTFGVFFASIYLFQAPY